MSNDRFDEKCFVHSKDKKVKEDSSTGKIEKDILPIPHTIK